jgi:maltose-binding protein MalE
MPIRRCRQIRWKIAASRTPTTGRSYDATNFVLDQNFLIQKKLPFQKSGLVVGFPPELAGNSFKNQLTPAGSKRYFAPVISPGGIDMIISFGELTRRHFMKRAAAAAALGVMPSAISGSALAATEDERILAAAKGVKPAGLRGMIWSNYIAAMKASAEDFKKKTGIGIESIQDISIFVIPQRAMAEAVSRSDKFDFFHVDSNMIPSLASAGLLEPLDGYMKKADFKINAVGDFANFMVYKGKTYGMPTDGNVHTHFIRWDQVEARRKEWEDKFGKPPAWPVTWEDDLQMMKFHHNPDKDFYGSANLRNRANGVTWWYMMFYSAGGFPFDDDMNPTLNNSAGKYAVEQYLRVKEVSHPEAAGWGTPQMIPRIAGGKAFACQYWDGIIALNENPKKSKTAGKWKYGLVPGSKHTGKLIHRSISSPIAAILVNRYSPRKEQAALMAMWWATLANSEQIVGDRVNTFHDPWHKGHMTSKTVRTAYTDGGVDAINKNLQITAPPVYLTGYLEFQDLLGKHLSEAYVGQLAAKDVLPKTEAAWAKVVRRIGKRKLKGELASYKAVFPSKNVPG